MPELIHHLSTVVSMVTEEISRVPTATLPSFLSLVSVLARLVTQELCFNFTEHDNLCVLY